MNTKTILIIGTILTVAIGIQLAAESIVNNSRRERAVHLTLHGNRATAAIIQRRVYDYAAPDRRGRIYYKYKAADGKTYKGKSWLTKEESLALEGQTKLELYYDPQNPLHHVIKAKMHGRR